MTFLSPWLAKITISGGQILTKNLHFRGHLLTFKGENTPKSRYNKAKTMLKNFLNDSKTTLKTRENDFLTLKIVENEL